MRDGNVVQLYVRQDHTYVGINEDGNVVTVANGRSPNSEDLLHPLCPLLSHLPCAHSGGGVCAHLATTLLGIAYN